VKACHPDAGRPIVYWSCGQVGPLGCYPGVVLLHKAALLQGPHPLNGDYNCDRHEVIESEVVGALDGAEQVLQALQLLINDTEDELDTIVGQIV
jgi:hypothetical protein